MKIKNIFSTILLFTSILYLNSFAMQQNNKIKVTIITGRSQIGKTYLVNKYLEKHNIPRPKSAMSYRTCASELARPHVGGTTINIQRAIASAKKNNPPCLVIDECDYILPLYTSLTTVVKNLDNQELHIILTSVWLNTHEINEIRELFRPYNVNHIHIRNRIDLENIREKIFSFSSDVYKDTISKMCNKTFPEIDFFENPKYENKLKNENDTKKCIFDRLTIFKTLGMKKEFAKLHNFMIILDDLKKVDKIPVEIAALIMQFLSAESCYGKKIFYAKEEKRYPDRCPCTIL